MSGNQEAECSRSVRVGTEEMDWTYFVCGPQEQPVENQQDGDGTNQGGDGNQDTSSTETTDVNRSASGAETTDVNRSASGAETTDGSQSKKRRERRQNVLSTERVTVNSVDPVNGEPTSPETARRSYGNDIGCINTKNLQAKHNKPLCNLLLMKLHGRYEFPQEDPDKDPTTDPSLELVNSKAIVKFTKALSSWKCRLREKIDEGLEFEEIHKKWPMITQEQYTIFKDTMKEPASLDMREWGKDLQAKNIGSHKLGSRGYLGKQPVWDKQDAEWARLNIKNPFEEFTDPQERAFIRARFGPDKETGVLVTDPKTENFVKKLVINLPS